MTACIERHPAAPANGPAREDPNGMAKEAQP